MKRINLTYWIITPVFVAFMLLGAIPDLLKLPDALKVMGHLGYPAYFAVFIGTAKLLGCVAILAPGFPRIREWAYAGLFFDLAGAAYSQFMTDGIKPALFFMPVPVVLLFLSYFFWHKKMNFQTEK